MKLLLVSAITNVTRNLGASKVTLDAANSLRSAGADCEVFPNDQTPSGPLVETLNAFLRNQVTSYDVIELPDNLNPEAIEVPERTLVVGRSVLLESHQRYIHFPEVPTTWKSSLKKRILGFYFSKKRNHQKQKRIESTERNLMKCDVINVANSRDKEVLIRQGCQSDKIIVLPYGIDQKRKADLGSVEHVHKDSLQIVFLGTFDFRKGCLDIVQFFKAIHSEQPSTKLKLLGTKGLIPSKEAVLAFFPKKLRSQIQVYERFSEAELPQLLANSDVGIFPSYWEGFGIGVVEMLAAGIPVIAYDSPGPCDILPPQYLVKPGDVLGLTQKVLSLSKNDTTKRIEAKAIANQFIWESIGKDTISAYEKFLVKQR